MTTRQELSHSDWFRGTNHISLNVYIFVVLGKFTVDHLLSRVTLLDLWFNELVVIVDQSEFLVNALAQNLSDL